MASVLKMGTKVLMDSSIISGSCIPGKIKISGGAIPVSVFIVVIIVFKIFKYWLLFHDPHAEVLASIPVIPVLGFGGYSTLHSTRAYRIHIANRGHG